MAIMGFDDETKWMKVLSINPGYSRKDVQDNCGFELKWADTIADTPPPTDDELRILREEVDPHRYIIGR
jgi:glutaconate CoA-transferase subunit B